MLGRCQAQAALRGGYGSAARPERPPYDIHEERASAAWHIFYNTREGRDAPRDAPAGRRRAMGRIEHTLLVGELSARPNRPKTFARDPTVPQKVTDVSIYSEGQKPRGVKTSRALGSTTTLIALPRLRRTDWISHRLIGSANSYFLRKVAVGRPDRHARTSENTLSTH